MLASAEGSLALLDELDAAGGAGERAVTRAYTTKPCASCSGVIEQLTRAQDDLRLARGDEDRFRIAARGDGCLGTRPLQSQGTSDERRIRRARAPGARREAGKQPTPAQIAKTRRSTVARSSGRNAGSQAEAGDAGETDRQQAPQFPAKGADHGSPRHQAASQ